MNELPSELSEHHKAHGPNWLNWLAPFIGKPGVAGLELGSWKGESAEWMLDHVFTGPHSHYTCVDTFQGSDEHHLAGIDCTSNEDQTRARLARFGNRARIRIQCSDWALRHFLADQIGFDFIYVDAAHDAMNVLRDSVLAFDLLSVGGVMLWDDYEWQVMKDEIDCPKLAIDSFLSCYARRYEVLGVGWQVAVKKLA